MQEFKTLIDRAAKICGSDSALARRIGIAQPSLAQMRAGRRTITPETAAEMAAIAGEDAREAAIAALLERSKGTRREGVLREILGKGLVAGVEAMSRFSYSESSNANTENRLTTSPTEHKSHCVAAVLGWIRSLPRWAGTKADRPASTRKRVPIPA